MKKIRITAAIFFICLGFFILWKSNLFQRDSSGNSNENQPAFSRYYEGNYKDAYNKLLPAAENGDAVAQVSLGNLYSKGLGVQQSYKDAYYWYKKAADQGNSDALGSIGNMYNNGIFFKESKKQAIKYYSDALKIKKNNLITMYNLALIYLNDARYKDLSKGLQLLEKAAEKNSSVSQSQLGMAYYIGLYGLNVNNEKAIELLRKSAEQGDPSGQNNLALVYYEGKAIKKNDFEAYFWGYIASTYGNNPKSKEHYKCL